MSISIPAMSLDLIGLNVKDPLSSIGPIVLVTPRLECYSKFTSSKGKSTTILMQEYSRQLNPFSCSRS